MNALIIFNVMAFLQVNPMLLHVFRLEVTVHFGANARSKNTNQLTSLVKSTLILRLEPPMIKRVLKLQFPRFETSMAHLTGCLNGRMLGGIVLPHRVHRLKGLFAQPTLVVEADLVDLLHVIPHAHFEYDFVAYLARFSFENDFRDLFRLNVRVLGRRVVVERIFRIETARTKQTQVAVL
jgi:hypothetical protein